MYPEGTRVEMSGSVHKEIGAHMISVGIAILRLKDIEHITPSLEFINPVVDEFITKGLFPNKDFLFPAIDLQQENDAETRED